VRWFWQITDSAERTDALGALAERDGVVRLRLSAVNRLREFVGKNVTTCGLIIKQRTHYQITGEPMKFLTLADWTAWSRRAIW
jgi:hypothetical protein